MMQACASHGRVFTVDVTTALCPVTMGEAAPVVEIPALGGVCEGADLVSLVTLVSTRASGAITMGEASFCVESDGGSSEAGSNVIPI